MSRGMFGNQTDTVHLYHSLAFADVGIEIVSEGTANGVHIGLKGRVNTLLLKGLARETHRVLAVESSRASPQIAIPMILTIIRSLCEGDGLNQDDMTINQGQSQDLWDAASRAFCSAG
jgi:hypothetical protein